MPTTPDPIQPLPIDNLTFKTFYNKQNWALEELNKIFKKKIKDGVFLTESGKMGLVQSAQIRNKKIVLIDKTFSR